MGFVSDLLAIPFQETCPPASTALVDCADEIQKQGLVVDTIATGHGRLGNMADLKAQLAVKAPAN